MSNMILFLCGWFEVFSSDFGVWGNCNLTIHCNCLDGLAQGLFANGLNALFDHRIQFLKKGKFSSRTFSSSHFILLFASALLRSFCTDRLLSFGICLRWRVAERYSFSPFDEYWYDSRSSRAFASQVKVVLTLLLNLSYLSAFVLGPWLIYWNGELSLSEYLWGTRFPLFFSLGFIQVLLFGKFGFPTLHWIRELLQYGKYIAGTNLFSRSSSKGWYLHELGYFLTCSPWVLFPLATKNYSIHRASTFMHWADNLSRLAATHRSNECHH